MIWVLPSVVVTVNASSHGQQIGPSAVVSVTLSDAVVLVAGRVEPVRRVDTVIVAAVLESLVLTPTIRYLPPATPGHARDTETLAVAKIL